ncbi:uncharacterized protein LOC116168669 [Photinus pyralis]|nr:uncharacterized protein LOC116168669 [Photinus pyralis]
MEDIPESFTSRPGTADVGKDYEIKIAALLCLRCMNNVGIQNMWLIMNADKCGAFDDVILSFENADRKNVTYLIQLKHTMKPSSLKRRELVIEQGNFYLPKYYDTIKDIKREMDAESSKKSDLLKHLDRNRNRMVYILFTTRGSPEGDYLINVSKTSNAESEWLLHECINTNGEIFSFNYEQLNFEYENAYQHWMENFYLFTRQVNISKVDVLIQTYIENFIRPVKLSKPAMDELYQKFMLHVSQWAKGELGGFYPLTKTLILKVLFECLLKPYMWNFEERKPDVNVKICAHLLSHISETAITVVASDSIVMTFLTSHIEGIIHEYSIVNDHKVLWKRHPEIVSKAIFRTTGRYKNIAMEAAYEFLWKTNELPLLLEAKTVENCKMVLQLLNIFRGIFKVIVLVDCLQHVDVNGEICTSLRDLGESGRIFVLNYPVKLQNRQHVKLSSYVSPEKFHLITIKDIIYIFMDEFNIGDLPLSTPDIFITQSLDPVWLKKKVLKEVRVDKFVIHYTQLDDVKTVLGKVGMSLESNLVLTWFPNCSKSLAEYRIIIVGDVGEVSRIVAMCNTSNTHFLLMQGRGGLEWVSTYGTNDNIAAYRKVRNMQDLSDYETVPTLDAVLKVVTPQINIISANPGMGKSTMLAFIANTAPTDQWILTLNLIDHLNYYKKSPDSKGHLQYFAKHCISSTLARMVFDIHVETKKVVLLFDGFDEIPSNLQKKVIKMIQECKELGCAVYLTTRTNVQPFLEESLRTFARSIIPFSHQDQFEYLKRYFTQNCSKDPTAVELIDTFTNSLLRAASDNLNDHDQRFTGVPLQTRLLCEVFKKDCYTYLRTQTFENKHFDLIYLYKHFIREKINIVCDKFGKGSEDLFHHYKAYRTLYALQSIFLKEDLEGLNIDEKLKQVVLLFPDTLQQLQKDGIVTIRNKIEAKFVHRTFAEYLTAKWLSKNFDDDDNAEIVISLVRKIFDPNFITVRNMFDRLMAKRSPLHLAVINRHNTTVKMIVESDKGSLLSVDRGDRSVHHLVASWGVHHPTGEMSNSELRVLDEMISKDPMIEVLNLLGQVDCRKDGVLNYTPIDYAIASGSLHIGDVLCSQIDIVDNCITLPELDTMYLSFYFELFPLRFLDFAIKKRTITDEVLKLEKRACEFEGAIHSAYRASIKGGVAETIVQLPTHNDSEEFSPLHVAVITGQLHIVQALLEQNVNVNASDSSGKTPLHWAAIKNNPNALRALLSNSADPNVSDLNEMTVLHYLSMINTDTDPEIISTLLESNAGVYTKDKYGNTPLHYAFHYSTQKFTHLFLDSKALRNNLSIADASGSTILHCAAYKGNESIVIQLLEYGLDVNTSDTDGKTPLHWASQKGHLKVVRCLALKGADLNAVDNFGRTPLYVAVDSNKEKLVKFLLDNGVSTSQKDTYGRTALYQAIAKNYEPIVALLLDRKSDVDAKDNENLSIMHWAAWSGHENIVKLLLSRKMDHKSQDKYGRIPLICAAQYGHIGALNSLLNDSDLYAKDENDMNSLHWCCWNGHIDIARVLLSRTPNLDVQDSKGRTAIMCSSHNGHANIARLLLTQNADVNLADNNNMTPLNWAAHNGYYETVKVLLQRNCILETKSHLGRTALSNAASKGHQKIVEVLLSNSFPVEVSDSEGMTALHTAAVHGHVGVIKSLTEHGTNLEALSHYNKTALIYAANYGQAPVVNYLLTKNVSLNAADDENMTALTWAAHDGHNDIVALLVNNGANMEIPNKHGRTPLLCAVHNNHYDVVKTLLLKGADVNRADNEGTYCIHQAVYNGNLETYRLLEHKFPVDFRDTVNRTPIIHAAFNGHSDLVKMLLEKEACINAQDDEGMSALHWACYNGHVDTVRLLLSRSADANVRDVEGRTPLVYAIVKQNEDIVSLLIDKADPNLKSDQNVSPLHVAAGVGNTKIVDILASNGADVNTRNNDGATPLMCASGNGREDVVMLLIAKKSRVEERDNNNLTALDWAKFGNHESVISLLENS